MKHPTCWLALSLLAAAVAATPMSVASAQVGDRTQVRAETRLGLTRNADALRALGQSLRRVTAAPTERRRLERAVAAGDVRAVRAVLAANGFPERQLSGLRLDLRGPRGSDDEMPGTIYLAVAHSGIGNNSSEALRMVKVGPGVWISWELIWLWITGEL